MTGHLYCEAIFIWIFLFNILTNVASHDLTEYVKLEIHYEKNANIVHFTLNCSSLLSPFGWSAEILINNITRANMRFSDGFCYISRRLCKDDECSCKSRFYVWSFWATADTDSLSFTCQVRFEQKNMNSHLLVYKTKIYNGSAISEEKTSFQQIVTSLSNSTEGKNKTMPVIPGSDDSSIGYIYILICVPVVIIIVSLLCFKCIKVRKKDEIADRISLTCLTKECNIVSIDDAKPLSPEELSLLEHIGGRLQIIPVDIYTPSQEQGTEGTVIIYPSISEEQKINGNGDGKTLSLEEQKINGIGDGKTLSLEEQKMNGIGDGKTLSIEEKRSIEIKTKPAYVEIQIEQNPEYKQQTEKTSFELKTKPAYVEIQIEQNTEFNQQTESTGERR